MGTDGGAIENDVGRRPAESLSWPTRRQARWALAVLIFIYAISFLDRILLSMVITPIKRDLALSDVQLGLLQGFAFVIFYVIAGFPLGRLADTRSRCGIILVGALVWTLSTAACGFAGGFASLFLLRIFVGIGEAALSPAAYSLIADLFRPEVRSRAVSIYQLGVTGGSTVAYILGGLVIGFAANHGPVDLGPLGALAPWRVAFLLIGIPGLLSVLLITTLREPLRRAPTGRATAAPAAGSMPWFRANHKAVIAYVAGYGCINMPFSAILAWGPTWLGRVHHLAPARIGLTLGLLMLLAGGSGQLLMALRSDRALARGRPTAVLDTGIVCALLIVPASAATMLGGLAPALALLAVIFFLACGAIGHAPSVIGQIAPNQTRGQLSAVYLLALNLIGSGLGSLLVALLTDRVFGDPAAVGTAIAITSAVGALSGAVLLASGRAALARSAHLLAEGTA